MIARIVTDADVAALFEKALDIGIPIDDQHTFETLTVEELAMLVGCATTDDPPITKILTFVTRGTC